MNSESLNGALLRISAHKNLALGGVFVFFALIFGALFFFGANKADAFACSAVAGTTNWSSPSSWTSCNNSYPGSPANGNADTVTIPDSAITMTADVSVTVASISFTAGGQSNSVTIADGVILTVSGSVTINAPNNSDITKEIAVTSGTLVANGITIAAGSGTTRVSRVSATTGTITTTNGISFSGVGAAAQLTTTGAATVNLTGTISGSAGTISLNSATTLVTVGTSAINLASTWSTVNVSSGTLTLGGVNITFAGPLSISGTLNTSSATGTVAFNNSVTVNSGGSLTFDGYSKGTTWAGDITHNGNVFQTSTLNAASASFGAGSYIISGSGDVVFGGSVSVSGTITNNSTGIVRVQGALSGAGSWVQGQNSYTRFFSTTSITTIDASTNTNTVEYSGSTQSVKPVAYRNLILSGSGTKTMTGVTNVNGDFTVLGTVSSTSIIMTSLSGTMTIGGTSSVSMGSALTVPNLVISGGSLTTAGFAFAVDGTTTISSGSLNLNNNTGAKTLTGQVTLSGGSLTGSSTGLVITTGITNNGGSVAMSGTATITTPGVVFDGSSTIAIYTVTVNSPGTVTNNGSFRSSTVINGTGSWTQGLNSTLTLSGSSSAISITTLDAASNANTVVYDAFFQSSTCKETQYYNIELGGIGSRSCQFNNQPILGDLTFSNQVTWGNGSYTVQVNGNLIISGGTLTVQREFTVNGTTTVTGGSTNLANGYTHTFTGMITTSAGTFGGANNSIVFNSGLTNNGGSISFTGTVTINSAGVTFAGSNTTTFSLLTVNNPGSVTNTGNVLITSTFSGTGSWTQGTGGVLTVRGATTNAIAVAAFDASTNVNTVDYASSSNQTVLAVTYHHLTLSGSGGTKTMTGVTTINGDFTASGTSIASAPVTSVGGNLVTSGTASLTLTASVAVAGSVNVGSGSTLIAPAGTLTVGDDFTRTGTFSHNTGTVIFNNVAETTVISGNPTFNNFSVTTAGKNIQVTSGETLTILGALTITGANGNNVVLTSTTGSSTFNMTFQNTSDAVTYATISWSACVSSYDINVYDGTSTNGGNNGSCWLFADPANISVSGTAIGNNAATVKISINGTVSGSTGTISNNAWSISNVEIPNNAVVVVWVDQVADINESTAVAKYDGEGDITGMVLEAGSLTIGSADLADFTVPDFAVYDYDNDEDIQFVGSASNIIGYSADIDYGMTILSGNTLTVGSGGLSETIYARDLVVEGELITTATGQVIVNGSYTNNGTYTANTGTFVFMSDKLSNILSGSMTGNSGKFYNLYFEGPGASWTASNSMEVANDLHISGGDFIAPSNLTVTGNFINYGTFTSGSGTVTLNATDSGNFITGTLIKDSKFNDLILNGVGGEWTVSGDVEVNGDLEVASGSFTGSGNLAVNGGSISGAGVVAFTGNDVMSGVVSISKGGTHNCAITELAEVYCWGTNSNGTLGNSDVGSSSIPPVKVMAGEATGADARNGYLTNIKYVGAGYYNTCAIAYSGSTYCWGQAQYGKLGNGQSVTNSTTPVKVLKGEAVGSDTDGTYLTNMKSVTLSYYHACGVSNDGVAYCWGGAQYGALGNGQTSPERTTPVRVQDGVATGDDTDGTYLINVESIFAGQNHSCALSETGKVYCWGYATSGQLGNGLTTPNVTTPVQVEDGAATGEDTDGTYLVNISYLASDSSENCAISNSGNTYCWGDSGSGQLGDNQTTVDRSTPVKVLAGEAVGADSDGTYLVNLRTIGLGDDHTCAVSNLGNAYCWGSGGQGAVGEGTGSATYTTPKRVVKGNSNGTDNDGTYLTNISDIAMGNGGSCAFSNSGMIYCWGVLSSGLGSQPNTNSNPSPLVVHVQSDNFVSLDTYTWNTCGLTSSSAVYCSGYNGYGAVGDDTLTSRNGMVPVHDGEATDADSDGTYLTNIKQIRVGTFFSCAVSYTANAYCWGYSNNGQLGDGQSTTNRSTPVRVHDGEATGADSDGTYLTNIKQIVTGEYYACGVANSGYVYCWGYAAAGRLGDGQINTNRTTPVRVQDGEATGADTDGTYLINVRQLSASRAHTCALTYSGNTYCWGTGASGRLGDGQSSNRTTPVRVHDGVATGPDSDGTYLVNIKEISAGTSHTCALSLSGKAYCWGESGQGQLGDSQTSTDITTPNYIWDGVAINADTDGVYLINLRTIEAGGTHTCGLSRLGHTYCWGPGYNIGVNDSATYSTPVKVQDGVATGYNSDGVYLINLAAVAPGRAVSGESGAHSCFLAIGGQFYCTGVNSGSGQFSSASYVDDVFTPGLGVKAMAPALDTMAITVNGTGSLGGTSDWNIPGLSFGSETSGTTTFSGSGAINVYGDMNIAADHTVNAGSKTITVKDDFANAGTFNGSTGTLVFDSSGNVTTVLGSGVTNFNNLTIATPGKTVQFESGQMFTINGTLAITGTAKDNITITSTTGDEQWLVNHQGEENVTYATISWSGCSTSPSSDYIDVSDGTSTDGGNNDSCWAFVPIVELVYGAGGGPTGGGPGTTDVANGGTDAGPGSPPTEEEGTEPGTENNSSTGGGQGAGGGASP